MMKHSKLFKSPVERFALLLDTLNEHLFQMTVGSANFLLILKGLCAVGFGK